MISARKKYQLINLLNSLFKEKFKEKLNFDWSRHPNRYEIIQKIIEIKKYKSYLEIGCFKNETFDKINIDKKIGVDPVSGGNIKLTSDEFFKINSETFDIIFIDGLHIYEQVRKERKNMFYTFPHVDFDQFEKESYFWEDHFCLPEQSSANCYLSHWLYCFYYLERSRCLGEGLCQH